jgi:hypothetical protein
LVAAAAVAGYSKSRCLEFRSVVGCDRRSEGSGCLLVDKTKVVLAQCNRLVVVHPQNSHSCYYAI